MAVYALDFLPFVYYGCSIPAMPEVSQAKGTDRIESLGMNMILCPPHLEPVVKSGKAVPKMWPAHFWGSPQAVSGELGGGNCFQNNTETWLAFSLAFALMVQRQHLIKTTVGNNYHTYLRMSLMKQ